MKNEEIPDYGVGGGFVELGTVPVGDCFIFRSTVFIKSTRCINSSVRCGATSLETGQVYMFLAESPVRHLPYAKIGQLGAL